MNTEYNIPNIDIAWCPGCGNYAIHDILRKTLQELNIPPEKLVIVSGIGQAAKAPQYIKCNYFNGLHGRSLPVATAIKACNPDLIVIAESGDGCMYGEGGNHLLHTIRRNPDITVLIHNNMVYGLTKGQASPTSPKGFTTPVQIQGTISDPINPISLAISQRASFVARAYCADIEQTKEIIKQAITHKGLAIVDILQPCVTFNKINTYKWFKEHTYYFKNHNPSDISAAFAKAIEVDPLPLGIFYKQEKPTFEEQLPIYSKNRDAIFKRKHDLAKIKEILDIRRG